MLSRRVMGGACHPGGGDYSIFKWKNNPCFGKRDIPASKWNGRCLSEKRDEPLREKHEERRHDSVSLCPRSAAENACAASAARIKQTGSGSSAQGCCFCSSPAGAARWLSGLQEFSDGHLLGKLPTPQLWNSAMAEFSAFRMGFCFSRSAYTSKHLKKDAAWINQKTATVGSIEDI